MKKGFGLLEVIAAALVLGFLLVGLNNLQLGNRETILRIRTRDAANNIAQEVLDSIRGLANIGIKIDTISKVRTFKSANFIKYDTLKAEVEYDVIINVKEDEDKIVHSEIEETELTNALEGEPKFQVKHNATKNIDVTVNWQHRKTPQSIKMSAVIK